MKRTQLITEYTSEQGDRIKPMKDKDGSLIATAKTIALELKEKGLKIYVRRFLVTHAL